MTRHDSDNTIFFLRICYFTVIWAEKFVRSLVSTSCMHYNCTTGGVVSSGLPCVNVGMSSCIDDGEERLCDCKEWGGRDEGGR